MLSILFFEEKCSKIVEMKIKIAQNKDVVEIKTLMLLAIENLQADYLTTEQISASHAGMGLDSQLIEDGTYYCVWKDNHIVGCGGWSFRATLYGGNHSAGRNAKRLNPATDRARIRAMYTHPDFTRQGIGKLILDTSEQAAQAAGFRSFEMAATLAGEPLYARCGYRVEKRWYDENGPVPVPLLTMVKTLS